MCTPARKKKRPINDQQSKKTTGAPFVSPLSTPPGEIEQKYSGRGMASGGHGLTRTDTDEHGRARTGKDIEAHGGYRTKKVILRIYDALQEATRGGD